MKLLLAAALSVALLASCVADAGFKVRGRIVAADGSLREECTVERLDREGRVLDWQSADGAFLASFTVAPGVNRFHIAVHCRGVRQTFSSREFEIVGSENYNDPIDLGVIQLND